MKRLLLLLLLLLFVRCSTNETHTWDYLTNKYFSYEESGHYDSAIIVGHKALDVALESFQKNDIRIAKSYNNLAEMYREWGNVKKALTLYKKAISIAKVNKDTLNLINFNTNLGLAYFDNAMLNEAKKTFEHSSMMVKTYLSLTDEKLIVPLSSLALLELKQKNFKSARKHLSLALRCVEENYEPETSKYASIYKDLGQLMIYERKPDSAFYYLTKAKNILENEGVDYNSSLANLYGLMGANYHITSNYDSAIKYYELEIKLRTKSDGKINPRAYQTLNNLGRLYIDLGKTDKGETLLQKALDLKNN